MHEPNRELFRIEAIWNRLHPEEGQGLIRVAPPWSWALTSVVTSAFSVALIAGCIGKVEVNGRARGILHPTCGIRVVVARLDGTVEQIKVRSGQPVHEGEVLLRIETPPTKASLREAERLLDSVRRHYQLTTRAQDQAHAEQSLRLYSRKVRLKEQIEHERSSTALFQQNLDRNLHLSRQGIQSPASVDEACLSLDQAKGHLSQLEQRLEHLFQEQAALEHAHQESLWQRRLTIQQAEVRVESQSLLLSQAVHMAPEGGVVEAMLVKPGELVRTGQPLCKLIPQEAPLHAVSFLEEKDRGFIQLGDPVVLELDQFPYGEYGTVAAQVERISEDLASTYELREALGDIPLPQLPFYRVELRILDPQAPAKAGILLRSGMLLNARFTLRRQRPITMILEPLRKWLR